MRLARERRSSAQNNSTPTSKTSVNLSVVFSAALLQWNVLRWIHQAPRRQRKAIMG